MKGKKFIMYAKRSFAMMKIKKMNLNYTQKSESIGITLENLDEQLIVFAI